MEEMWLARDNSGSLHLFIYKPKKYAKIWLSKLGASNSSLDRELFPYVKWSDDEPTKVKLVIITNNMKIMK